MLKKVFLVAVIFLVLAGSVMELRAASGFIGNGKGAGLAGATVIIGKHLNFDTGDAGTDTVSGTGCTVVTTDENGNFSVTLPAGTYDILVWKAGYTPQIDFDMQVDGYSTDIIYDNQGRGLHNHLVKNLK